MLKAIVDHPIAYVIPAARDYNDAEVALSAAFAAAKYDQIKCQADCELFKRRAAEVAVAIDGLADRAAHALGTTANAVRAQVAPLSAISGTVRQGCVDRVCAVAMQYKHAACTTRSIPSGLMLTCLSWALATASTVLVWGSTVAAFRP